MDITLTRASLEDAERLHRMQVESFMPLLQKYQDFETNPASEPLGKVADRLKQPFTDYYLIRYGPETVGGIRIVKMGKQRYRVSPVFVLPEYQGKGIAQQVFRLVEDIYRDALVWELETIQQEAGNCHLYEKVGYRLTGMEKIINSRMTLVGYEKQAAKGKGREV
jgi:GNAT superfamily N-acetyltransferase